MSQFLIIAEDYSDDEALNRRLVARPTHLERMKREKAKGRYVFGGAMLNASGKMNGSMLVVDLDDETQAQTWVQNDPYFTGLVWERISVRPFVAKTV